MDEPRKFIDPETGKPDDRSWLDDEVLNFITSGEPYYRVTGGERRLVSECHLYERIAPIQRRPYRETRPSWSRKPRKVKRQMLEASLRRLIANGKIKVEVYGERNAKSMHGIERANIENDRLLFGKKYDGKLRYYSRTNALEALAKALSDL
jgi:hypothetical protein